MNEDWDKPTILRKSRPSSKTLKSSTAINEALAKGNVQISLKEGATKNKQTNEGVNFAKIESSEELKVPKVSTDVSKAIQAARQKLGFSQKELATKINEKLSVINDLEANKGLPNQAVLGKLERVLGVKLRGTGIGTTIS